MTKQLSMQYDAEEEVGKVKDVRVGDITEIISGYAFKSKKFNNDGLGMPVIRIRDVGKNVSETFTEEGYPDSALITDGDFLIGMDGDFRLAEWKGGKALLNQRVCKVVPNETEINARYLLFFLPKELKRIEEKTSFATVKHLSVKKIKHIKIPLPPLPIQRKIAEVLDRADALRQRQRQIIAHYDQLAQSTFLDMFGDPVKNPKGWDIKKLQSFGNWRSGGTPSRKNSEYFNGTIPWLSSGELENIFLDDSNEHITEEAIKRSAASIIEPYSLLLGMYDTAALKSTINTVPCSCNQAIAFAKINSETANTVFLYYLIQIGKEHYRRLQRGVRQKNMNLSMIKSMPVSSPPLSLQNQFATIIQRIETQKQRQQAELTKSEELFQSLLQRAFRGELFIQEKKIQQMDMF